MSLEAMTWAMNARRTGPMADGARLVLIALADYASNDGTGAYPSKRGLAERLGVTERTVQRHLAALRESGHIVLGDPRHVAHYPADRRPTVYDLELSQTPPTRGDSPVLPTQDGETDLTPTGRQNVSKRGDSPVSQTKNLNPHTNPTPQPPSRRKPLATCPVCAEEFRDSHSCKASALDRPAPASSRTSRTSRPEPVGHLCRSCGRRTTTTPCQVCQADPATAGPPPPGLLDAIRAELQQHKPTTQGDTP